MQAYKHNVLTGHIDQQKMLDIMQLAHGMGETGRVETGQMVDVLISFLKGVDVETPDEEKNVSQQDKS